MNGTILIVASLLVIAGIFAIATSSIGVQCYNENEKFKEGRQPNFIFMIVTLVSAILMISSGSSAAYIGAQSF